MKIDELSPFERVIDQVGCHYPKSATTKNGVMIITTCRVLWKPSAEAAFPVEIFRSPLTTSDGKKGLEVQGRFNELKKYWVLKINAPETAETPKADYFFRFEGPRAAEDCTKVE